MENKMTTDITPTRPNTLEYRRELTIEEKQAFLEKLLTAGQDFDGNKSVDAWEADWIDKKIEAKDEIGDIVVALSLHKLKFLADSDGDKKITQQELDDVFSTIDTDGNGKLSAEEIHDAFDKKIQKIREEGGLMSVMCPGSSNESKNTQSSDDTTIDEDEEYAEEETVD